MTVILADSACTPEALLTLCERLKAAGIQVHAIHAAEHEQVALFVSAA